MKRIFENSGRARFEEIVKELYKITHLKVIGVNWPSPSSPAHLPRPLQCEYPNSLTNSNPTQSPAWLTSYARQRGRRREGSQRNDGRTVARDWSTGVGAASRVCAGGQPLKDVP